jgi:hypothetical protein
MVNSVRDSENSVRHPFKKLEKPLVKCRKCGYMWTPNPTKWKGKKLRENLLIVDGHFAKLLFCPSCLAKSYIGIKEVNRILGWYIRANRS